MGRLILGGTIRKISLVLKVLYHYHSAPHGNYRRNAELHRAGVASALNELARRYFDDRSEYRWVASGRPLPSLYTPTRPDDGLNLPAWAALNRNRWSLQVPDTKASIDPDELDYPLPAAARLTYAG